MMLRARNAIARLARIGIGADGGMAVAAGLRGRRAVVVAVVLACGRLRPQGVWI
jgi:hypothetical protein